MATARKTTAPDNSGNPVVDKTARDYALKLLNAPSWRPEKGETLTAYLVGLSKGGVGGEYGMYPILILEDVEDVDHVVAFHAFHTIVKDQLAEIGQTGALKPKSRPVVTIHYVGHVKFGSSHETEKGLVYVPDESRSDYHNYTVFLGDGSDLTAVNEEIDFSEFVRPEK